MTRLSGLLLALAALLAVAAPLRASEPVDVALALAVDISLSMDQDELRAQRDGYVAALEHPAVLDAIARGARGRIALTYFEWAGPWSQTVVAPWTVIETAEDAAAFAQRLAFAPLRSGRGTSISGAIAFGLDLLGAAPPADRRVLDISGDGPNNLGVPVEQARDAALAQGVEINGLPLMFKRPDMLFSIPDLDIYYEECVIGGPTAFVLPVLGPDRFVDAIRTKLIMEIAGVQPPARLIRASSRRIDCMIGERLYRAWRSRLDGN